LPSSPSVNQPTTAVLWPDRINQAYYGELGGETGRKARDRINWMCSQAQGETVLDVGCSQGITTLLLAREGFKVTGLDISEAAIDYARSEQEKEVPSVRERVDFVCTDLAGLDSERQFDTVILGEVLEHQTHTSRFLGKAASHVRQGGVLIVTVPFGLHPFPDHKATVFPRELLASVTGFSVTSMDIRDNYIRFVACKDGGSAAGAVDLAAQVTEAGTYQLQLQQADLQAKHSTMSKNYAESKKAVEERTRRLSAAQAAHDALAIEQAGLQTKFSQLESELVAAIEARTSLERSHADDVARLKGDLAVATQRRAELESELAAALQVGQTTERELVAQMTALQGELKDAALAHTLAQSQFDESTQALQVQARAQADQLAALRAELAQAAAQRAGLETRLASTLQQHVGVAGDKAARIEWLQAELARTQAQCAGAEKKLAQVRDRAVSAQQSQAGEVAKLRATIAETAAKQAQATASQKNAEEKIASLEKRMQRDAELMARKQAALEMSAMAVRKTLSFQLGNLLINGFKSPGAFFRLPGALITLRAEAKTRRGTRRNVVVEAVPTLSAHQVPGEVSTNDFETLMGRFSTGGVAAVSAYLAERDIKPEKAAAAFTLLARHLQSVFPEKAAQAAREAYTLDPQPYRAKWLAFRLFEAGFVTEPAGLLSGLQEAGAELSVSEQRRAEEVAALARLRAAFPAVNAALVPAYDVVPSSLLYVAASSMPYHTSGYTVRTHELVRAMAADGLDVTVLTRPGYPWDRVDRKGDPAEGLTVIDGISYLHRRDPSQALPLDVYIEQAARVIADAAAEKRVAAIHAASNHVNALPALLAARSLGIPFVYEMRGLWELSRASRVPGYETSERYQIGLDLEAHVALHADRVYVISNALGELIQGWGVDAARISLLPNCINADTILRAEKGQVQKIADVFTVGYAGAMVGYEGLDVLIDAIGRLKERGQRVHARLIGDGDMRAALEAMVQEAGLSEQVEFRGKLPPDRARAELAATNAVAIPRKPHHVCEIIPPIKLVEAMALGMPVIVPNLPVFCEEVVHESTGIVFNSGDAADLATALERLIDNPQLMAEMGERARQHATTARVWRTFTKQIKANLDTDYYQDLFLKGGSQSVVDAVVRKFGVRNKEAALELLRIGKLLAAAGHESEEIALAQQALVLNRSESVLRGAFWVTQRARNFSQSCDIILELEQVFGDKPSSKQRELLEKMQATPAYLLTVLKAAQPKQVTTIDTIPGRLCYVLHNTLPYSSGGYATRSHGVASGIRAAGWDVVVLSRPGFPLDIKPELTADDVTPIDTVDDIAYVRTLAPLRAGVSAREYVLAAADAMEARLREYRPAVVMAASNHITALPALIAARRLGIPFIYEVRGLWEITRLSRDMAFGDSPAFHVQRMLEAGVAAMADHVFTLTEPMREELVDRGVPYAHVDLLPNSCDPTRFEPIPRDESLAAKLAIPAGVPVIGYIGTFVDYEGLEHLAEACALLKQDNVEFRLLMVGNENASGQTRGPITEEIIRIAEESGFSDWLILTGRVPHEEVEAYYSLVDVAPFPRKPLPVCEMVSPMKPLEALAMEKAVVVSSVRALVEMVQHDITGLVFEKGNTASLAATLQRLIDAPELRARLGENGRKWVERERTWVQIGEKAGVVLTRISGRSVDDVI